MRFNFMLNRNFLPFVSRTDTSRCLCDSIKGRNAL